MLFLSEPSNSASSEETAMPSEPSSANITQAQSTATDTSSSHLQSHENQTATTTADATDASTMPPSPSLSLILAATPSLGIGKAGALPWPMLRKEMGYFARVTKRVAPASKATTEGAGEARQRVNAVIMGRKTWDSIPPKFRPLKGRLNVVLTRSAEAKEKLAKGSTQEGVEGPLVATGILDALSQLSSLSSTSPSNKTPASLRNVDISRIFIIGGASLYRTALELPQTKRILLTQIRKEYECDTFFPLNLQETTTWKKVDRRKVEEWTGEEIKEGGEREGVDGEEVGFEFGMWERVAVD